MTIQGLLTKIFKANQTPNNTVNWSGVNGLKTIQEDIVGTIRERTFFTVPTTADLLNQGFNNAILCYVQDHAFFRWQATGIPNGTTIFPANDGGVWKQETIGDTDGTVTSIGVSMPSAFTVANSPVTTSGVINVTGAGTTSQYIDGTGSLQLFPDTHGIPTGGTTGQILTKASNVDYDATWMDNFADWTEQLRDTVKADVAINKGQAVYISGANGTNQLVSLASNTSEATSSKTLGLAMQNFAINDIGQIVTEGLLGGLNTLGANAGDPVWLGVNGNLIFGLINKPVAPAHLVYIGVVTRVNSNNGEIYVKVQNGFELQELHNVSITNPVNNDGIFYNSSTSLWVNKSISTVIGGNPVIGNGTTNYLPKWTSGSALGNSLVYEDGTNVGIGTTSPGQKLDVNGTGRFQSSLLVTNGGNKSINHDPNNLRITIGQSGNFYNHFQSPTQGTFQFINDNTSTEVCRITNGKQVYTNQVLNGFDFTTTLNITGNRYGISTTLPAIEFNTFDDPGNGYNAVRMRLFNGNSGKIVMQESSGNVLIGTSTDAGYKLDVNGTSVFRAQLTLVGNLSTGGNRNYIIGNNGNFEFTTNTYIIFRNWYNSGDQYLLMDYPNGGRATFSGTGGIGYRLAVGGAVTASTAIGRGLYTNPTLYAAANNDVLVGVDIAPTFTNGAYTGLTNLSLRVNGYTKMISSDSTGGRIIDIQNSSANTCFYVRGYGDAYLWQTLYLGTLNGSSYISSGSLSMYSGVGTGSTFVQFLHNNGNVAFKALSNSVLQLNPSAGNVLVGTTTDAGYKLDVNGTGRFTPNGSAISAFYIQTHGTYVNRTRLVVGATDGANNNSGLQFTASTGTGKTYINGWDDGGTSQYDIVISSNGGRVQFGTDSSSEASSQVTINSTTRGFLPPRMTNAQRTAIATPAVGLIVYCTDAIEGLYIYKSTGWTFII